MLYQNPIAGCLSRQKRYDMDRRSSAMASQSGRGLEAIKTT